MIFGNGCVLVTIPAISASTHNPNDQQLPGFFCTAVAAYPTAIDIA